MLLKFPNTNDLANPSDKPLIDMNRLSIILLLTSIVGVMTVGTKAGRRGAHVGEGE